MGSCRYFVFQCQPPPCRCIALALSVFRCCRRPSCPTNQLSFRPHDFSFRHLIQAEPLKTTNRLERCSSAFGLIELNLWPLCCPTGSLVSMQPRPKVGAQFMKGWPVHCSNVEVHIGSNCSLSIMLGDYIVFLVINLGLYLQVSRSLSCITTQSSFARNTLRIRKPRLTRHSELAPQTRIPEEHGQVALCGAADERTEPKDTFIGRGNVLCASPYLQHATSII